MSINQVSLSAHTPYIKQQNKEITNQEFETQKKDSGVHIEEILEPVEQTVVNSVAPARRIVSIPDMLKQGDTTAALGLAALTLVSLPEDCRDIRAAYQHSACVLTKKRIPLAYNYRKYQHDFSFLRGTLLHEAMKKVKSERGQNIVDKIYKCDKTLYNTKFGIWLQKMLGIKNGKPVISGCKTLWGNTLNVQKINVEKDFFGLKELTGRALKRTTVLGLTFTALLELPKVIKSFKKDENIKERVKSVSIQGAKSGINIFGITAGMGYLGAIGAKKFGAAGSLIGMGLGAITGAALSNKANKMIFNSSLDYPKK